MPDRLSQSQRSELMARIKGRDTMPEQIVRGILRQHRVNYRSHVTSLPGSPDIVIDAAKTVIFVHGCFWHRHSCPRGESCPATRTAFWQTKFARNTRRDRQAARVLRRSGWSVVTVWECQTARAKRPRLTLRLRRFLVSRTNAIGATASANTPRLKAG
ncbi:MAG: DNA mismatch endonuclease Vsr [Phycisphaerales bacterium]|nr:DNA mismatch endonuclease Vsr [Phycisphaerales bacterium]